MSALNQIPAPGEHSIQFRGDTITFILENHTGQKGKAWLRSNIGHAETRHAEIIAHAEQGLPPLSRDWHDLPMKAKGKSKFEITLPLLGVGRFEAKAYFIENGADLIQWPDGGNSVIKVEPAETCSGNTMYTAFVRQFGDAKYKGAIDPRDQHAITQLDHAGYTVIPKGGTFRDLINELDFIVGHLRCKIVQLLPIHPTPTTYGRMGRFGGAFSVLDLFDIDPAHGEFDKLTTPLEQFQELVDEVHKRAARVYLDMPINHTGWAAALQINHPEWYERKDDGKFKSPGAWGVEWADLVELNHEHRELWKYLADVFLFWCRKGVDGFRCDAGYMVPFEAWQYIIAKVRMEYPDAIFMLEGLGGHKHVTENLLANSGMNWAYSEIFQNHDQGQVDGYLPESIRVSESLGNLIHFAETHDNARLAATSYEFARLRVAFCALTSHNGAFGFANGVEWYADTQISVHEAHSLNWSSEPNMIDWIRRVHATMEVHPAFHAGAKVEIITHHYHNSAAVLRTDATGEHQLLVLANLNHEGTGFVEWQGDFSAFKSDLLAAGSVEHNGQSVALQPGQVLCLGNDPEWINAVSGALDAAYDGTADAKEQMLKATAMNVYDHFGAVDQFDVEQFLADPKGVCEELAGGAPIVTTWTWPRDAHREVMLPPGHFLLVKADVGFIAELKDGDETLAHEKALIGADGGSFALFKPLDTPAEHTSLTLKLSVFEETVQRVDAPLLQLCEQQNATVITTCRAGRMHDKDRYAVITNEHGALSQVRVGWADIRSKYDGLLSANLDPEVPVDRHTMFARCRAWVVCRDYSNELSLHCQKRFTVADDGTVIWNFAVPVGEGQLIPLKVALQSHPDTNAVKLTFLREAAGTDPEHLADDLPISLILRPDIEDRNNHEVTKAMNGAEANWPGQIHAAEDGFVFAPAQDRKLELKLAGGTFHSEPEWYYMIPHPVDRERGIDGESDLHSPGYFSIELQGQEQAELVAGINGLPDFAAPTLAVAEEERSIEASMQLAMKQFIVKRDDFQTVIAGYPWFLDWGRDTLICLRGIIEAGYHKEAENILLQFAKYEKGGTIPNMIRGNDDNNRETSDAPLWLYVACDELMQAQKSKKLLKKDCGDGRTVKEVLIALAHGLIAGTENGIAFDAESGLIFSPSHYTWMDTNYPAGTPRKGYPIEIQAMWRYALNMLAKLDKAGDWKALAQLVDQSIQELFRIEADDFTYLADCLACEPGVRARDAEQDDALRSNQLLAVTLGAVADPELQRQIVEACEQLLIPGAIRSLADRPVQHPCPVHNDGHLLNDPQNPYWGHYSGDEDTRRKPAYHNGTAWTWPFPSYAEALVMVHGEAARDTALAILGSASTVLNHGCLRQSPEVIDGNFPHTQRGCGAQAWGVTELYRVVKQLESE